MYYECKIKIDKITQEDVAPRTYNEVYFVDAMTLAEAESRVLKEQAPFASGPIEVESCKKVKLTGIVETDNPAADKYFKIKVMFVNYDEERQKEKRVANYFYVHSATLLDAVKLFQDEEMKNWQIDYEVVSVTDTPIMDIYKFSAESATAAVTSRSEETVADEKKN